MGKISEFTPHDHEVIARDYADLKEAARKRCSDPEELAIIQKAFEFANEAHKCVRRRSGEPYILHPIAVATNPLWQLCFMMLWKIQTIP